MLQLLRSKFGPDLPAGARQDTVKDPASLEGIQLFEALVSETHAAVLRTAAVASCVNALASGRQFRALQIVKGMLPQQPSLLEALPRCQKELGLQINTPPVLMKYFVSLGYAQAGIATFCDDAEQWGAEQAVFLHLKNLSLVWRRVSHLALNAVATLDPEVERCLPSRYGQNTAVLKKLLAEVLRGGQPCLDANGLPFLPELPQRRPAARREANTPCIVEHLGKTARAVVKDISSSGLGLERAPPMTPQKVALVEFEDGRCFAGVVVWAKGANAGIKFDTPLRPDDPILLR